METTTETKKTTGFVNKLKAKWKIYLIELLILVIGGILLWKFISDGSNASHAADREAKITAKANEALEASAKINAHVASLGLSLAIREQISQQNVGSINTMLGQFVKENQVINIVLIDNNQQVMSATDKKNEGKTFKEVFPNLQFPEKDPPTPYIAKNGALRTFTNIMDQFGRNRVAVLIVEYQLTEWDLSVPKE